jgi:hypothetical protein
VNEERRVGRRKGARRSMDGSGEREGRHAGRGFVYERERDWKGVDEWERERQEERAEEGGVVDGAV